MDIGTSRLVVVQDFVLAESGYYEMTLHERIQRVMFIGVEFHPQKYKIGQDEINQALDDGYEILWDYKYDSGVVFCLKKSVKNTSDWLDY